MRGQTTSPWRRFAVVLLMSTALAACEAHIAGDNPFGPMEIRWVSLGRPDERDFNSPCRYFGNVTPFSDRPVYSC
jgi:hypothetical protein